MNHNLLICQCPPLALLGKTNYLLKELIKRGQVKVKNFTNNPEKLKKINYFLTEKGLKEKFRLLQHFLQIKESEYNKLKQEWEHSLNEKTGNYPPRLRRN